MPERFIRFSVYRGRGEDRVCHSESERVFLGWVFVARTRQTRAAIASVRETTAVDNNNETTEEIDVIFT